MNVLFSVCQERFVHTRGKDIPAGFEKFAGAVMRTIIWLTAICLGLPSLASGAENLVSQLSATRVADGIIISGAIGHVPAGTKITVAVAARAGNGGNTGQGPESPATVGADGTFKSEVLTDGDRTFGAGRYKVEISAIFNVFNQSTETLEAAGVSAAAIANSALNTNPAGLPESPDFVPDDPEFPKVGRSIAAMRSVELAPITADQQAIEEVKFSVLTTPEQGRSSMNVVKSVAFFVKSGVKVGAWSSAAAPDGTWLVSLAIINDEGPAIWSVDLKSKKVHYANPLAKTLSYVPRD